MATSFVTARESTKEPPPILVISGGSAPVASNSCGLSWLSIETSADEVIALLERRLKHEQA
jgi:hypothetical protein